MQANPDHRDQPSDAPPQGSPPPVSPPPPVESRESSLTDAAFDLAPVGLTLTDGRGRFVRVNRAFANICGYAPQDLVGRDYASLLAPEEAAASAAADAGAERAASAVGDAHAPRDWQVVTRDGRRRTLRSAGTSVVRRGGEVLTVSAVQDVTAERQTERALLEAGQRLNSVLASITEGYMVLDEELRFVEINPAAQRMIFSARPVAELIGRAFADEYPQSRGSEFYDHFRRAFRERVPVHFEARSVVAGRWFETHAYPRDSRLEIYVRDITERKESEEALRRALAGVRDSEAHVRLIADNLPAMVSYVDRGLRYRFANSAYSDWFGRDPASMIGMTIPQVLGPREFEPRRPYVERALRGERVRFETQTTHKDLGPRETEVCYAPDLDPDPRDPSTPARGFFVFVYDVTDRKRAERALRENERALREAYESIRASEGRLARAQQIARLGNWELDWITKEVTWSDEMYRLFGVSPESFTPTIERFFELVPPEDHAAINRALEEALADCRSYQVDHRIVLPGGAVRHVSEQAEIVCDEQGKPLRFVGTMLDVTDRVRAAEALAASEREFRAMFELANSGKGQAEPGTGRLKRVNRKLCQITGYEEHELLGMTFYDITHPDDRAADRQTLAALQRGEIREWMREKRYVRKDGSVAWVSVAGSAIRDESGKVVRLVATVQDISARKCAEEAARAAREQAEAANRAKDQFLAVLSHELRTPLTPVVMTLAGLEMDRSLSQGVRDDLAMIRRNVELETKLIDDLLDVTRIANGKLRLHAQPADTHALIEGVLDLFHSELRVKALDVRCELGAADARVSADPARLQQVFWNLVRNAIKFTPEGGRVVLRTTNPTPRTLAVEVTDSGIGIEPSALPRLFNAFEQAGQSITRQFGGLGLGLAISKALVELHGGTVRAESPGRGRGATFTVELPTVGAVEKLVSQIDPAPGETGLGLGAGAGEGAAGGAGAAMPRPATRPTVRVLLVEDHPDTLRILTRLLERMGYAVVTASSAAGALDALSGAAVDVIVSDIGLPDGTGHELMRKVKATPAHAAVPAIAISGFGMDADVRSSREAGFMAHMTKPVDVRQLDAAIRRVVKETALKSEI